MPKPTGEEFEKKTITLSREAIAEVEELVGAWYSGRGGTFSVTVEQCIRMAYETWKREQEQGQRTAQG